MAHSDADVLPGERIAVDLAQPLALSIHSPNGDVTVRAVERSDVLVDAAPAAFGVEGDESALTITARGNRIEVRPNPLAGGWTGFGGEADLESIVDQVAKAFRFAGPRFGATRGTAYAAGGESWLPDITVEIPRSLTCWMEVHAASGDVRVEGVSGDVTVNTMSGGLRAVRTAGSLELHTVSGDLAVEEATARLTVQAASGDVRVVSSQLDGFEMQTASGDVFVDAILAGDGPYRAQTASGDVFLSLRRPAAVGDEPDATLAFHTVSGDARVTPPFRRTERRRWRSGRGDSAPYIAITTVSGDLSAAIAAAEPPAGAAPSPPVLPVEASSPPPPRESPAAPDAARGEGEPARGEALVDGEPAASQERAARLAVLEAVERGEIDVEEALRRLDAEEAVANP